MAAIRRTLAAVALGLGLAVGVTTLLRADQPKIRVSLTSPPTGAVYHAPGAIPLSATVAVLHESERGEGPERSGRDDYNRGRDRDRERRGDSDAYGERGVRNDGRARDDRGNPHEEVVRVEFYQGRSLIGSVSTPPYAYTWVNVAPGSYTLTARAVNAKGESGTSLPTAVRVNAVPSVAIAAPASGAVVTPGNVVGLSATATDADGAVSKVDFYVNAALVGSATTAPYQAVWTPTVAGAYTLVATATDNSGAVSTSAPVMVRANALPQVSLIAGTPVVNAPGTITLTASAQDGDGTITRVDYLRAGVVVGSMTAAPYTLTLTGVSAGTYAYTANAYDNDGALATSSVVLVRVNAPPSLTLTSPISNAVLAARANILLTATASDADGAVTKVEFFANGTLVGVASAAPYAVTWAAPASGTYTITAVATDSDGATTSSPSAAIRVNAVPQVSLIAPVANATVNAPGGFTVTANAADNDGAITKVEFYANGGLIGGVTQAPYSILWNNVSAGAYTLRAIATDSDGGTTTSAAVAVRVNGYPSVTLTSPIANATFKPASTITLTATAHDLDGAVNRVEFYAGTTLLATVTAAPYSYVWTGYAAGSHTLTARAVDDTGAGTVSVPVSITVANPEARVYYIHTDHLNTPRAITNQNRELVWTWANDDPFGANPANEDPRRTGTSFTCNLRFPGQYFDRETGLHYNYFRDYIPGVARYIQSDPIGLRGGVHTYAYVGNDPISKFDAFGLDETVWMPGRGRSISDGPRNGNWCGGNWSGGQVPSLNRGQDGPRGPVDSLDRCCMVHDRCYAKCDRYPEKNVRETCLINCDGGLVRCLRDLDDDCTRWAEPPRPRTESDSQWYRDDALRHFYERSRRWEVSNRSR